MYAILTEVTIDDARGDEATKLLHEQVVPAAKGFAGHVAGYWCRSEDGTRGRSIVLYESKDAADAALAAMQAEGAPPPGAPVTLGSAEVYEVLATA